MEKKRLGADTPVTVAGVTLIPVTETILNRWPVKKGVSFLGIKRPMGVIMISPSWKKAFRISGEEIPLDQFIQEVPGIKEVLDDYH